MTDARRQERREALHLMKNYLGISVGFCDLLMADLPPGDSMLEDLQAVRDANLAALDLLPRLDDDD